jgi:hypothetical protein
MKTYLFPVIAIIATGVAAYLVGHHRGVEKGAHIGALFASSYIDSHKDLILLLERSMAEASPKEGEMRELMISFLAVYPSQRALLQARPFSVPYRDATVDEERISAAIARLKERELRLEYKQ